MKSVIIAVLCCLGFYGFLVIQQAKSLRSKDRIELNQHYLRWQEAGQPQGAALDAFLQGRRALIATQQFNLGGTNLSALFMFTNVFGDGTLFITTNGIIIRQFTNGHYRAEAVRE